MPCQLHAGFYNVMQVWSKTAGCSVKMKAKVSNGVIDVYCNSASWLNTWLNNLKETVVDLIMVRTTTVSFRLSFISCDDYTDDGDWTLVRCDRFYCWLSTPLTTAEYSVLYYLATVGNSKVHFLERTRRYADLRALLQCCSGGPNLIG